MVVKTRVDIVIDSDIRALKVDGFAVTVAAGDGDVSNNVLEYIEGGDEEYQAPELGVSIDVEP
jgi:predicted Fe-Mo cluster-binding NifX family protein